MMQSLCDITIRVHHKQPLHLFQASDHMSVFYKKISRLFLFSSGRGITIFCFALNLYIFPFAFLCCCALLPLQMECIVVTEVPPCFMKNWWLIFIKGWIRRKVLELDTGCLKVLWGMWARVSDISSSSDSLAIASSRFKPRAEWSGVSSCSKYSSSPVVFLFRSPQSGGSLTMKSVLIWHRKPGNSKTVNTVETIFKSSSLSLPMVDLMITEGTSILKNVYILFSSSFHERLSSAKCS